MDARTSNTNYNELLHGIQLPLSAARLEMVECAFKILDKDGSKIIDASDLAAVYDASQHPDVAEGKKTTAQVTTEFLKGFEGGTTKDGRISRDEFVKYYEDLGASIPSDEYFVEMMKSCWKLDATAAASKGGCSSCSGCDIPKLCGLLKQRISQKTKTGQRLSLTLKKIFDFFDVDESGAVTDVEFTSAMVRLGIHLSDKEQSAFFTFFAGDDGKITTKEFIEKMNLDDY